MFGISARKAATIVSAGVLATAGLLATATTAHASGFTVRLAPFSMRYVYVDVSEAATGDGAPIIQWDRTGDNQIWTFQPVGSAYQIVNKHSGKCITTDGVAGHQLRQWRCHGTSDQLWDTSLTPGDGYFYTIRSLVGSGNLYMDVTGGAITRGTPIGTWYENGGANQSFTGVLT